MRHRIIQQVEDYPRQAHLLPFIKLPAIQQEQRCNEKRREIEARFSAVDFCKRLGIIIRTRAYAQAHNLFALCCVRSLHRCRCRRCGVHGRIRHTCRTCRTCRAFLLHTSCRLFLRHAVPAAALRAKRPISDSFFSAILTKHEQSIPENLFTPITFRKKIL